jgi:hypothetical protein
VQRNQILQKQVLVGLLLHASREKERLPCATGGREGTTAPLRKARGVPALQLTSEYSPNQRGRVVATAQAP